MTGTSVRAEAEWAMWKSSQARIRAAIRPATPPNIPAPSTTRAAPSTAEDHPRQHRPRLQAEQDHPHSIMVEWRGGAYRCWFGKR